MPGETFRTTIVPTGETGKNTVLRSGGNEFWDSLPTHQKDTNRDPLAEMEYWLRRNLPELPPIPADLLADRHLTLGGALNQQTDPKTCIYIAVANAMRILGEPDPEYSLRGLQQKIQDLYGVNHDQLTFESVDSILRSGKPFDKFRTVVAPNMFTFLGKLQTRSAVTIMDWPSFPAHIRRNNAVRTHARTVTGFTRNREGLFFHFVDPYITHEVKAYSFRDLIMACLYQSSVLANGVTPDSIDRVARNAWIIEKVS